MDFQCQIKCKLKTKELWAYVMVIFTYLRWTAYRDRGDPLPINARDNGDGMLTIRDVTEIDGILDYCCDVGNNYGNVLSKCIRINVLSKYLTVKQCPVYT